MVIYDPDSGQNGAYYRGGFLSEQPSGKIYGSVVGRMLIRPLVTPVVSIAMGWILDSRLSAAAVKPFIRFNHLDMSDYEKRKYISYNDFSSGRSGRVPAILIWNRDILSVPVTAG